MLFLILFAFIAGIVTILSPCILPVLPVVLSSSVAGGKKRPLGVVSGFVLSFTFFTLFLSALVRLTGLSADGLRFISIVVILGFGLSLFTPRVQIFFESLVNKFSGLIPKNNPTESGYKSGLIVGLSLGLLWTPCVGPILASVITLAATSQVNFAAVLITLAYSVGTAIPMTAVMFGGRQLLQKVPWLLSKTPLIQKVFGAVMILTAVGMFFNIDRSFQSYILEKFPAYGTGLTNFENNGVIKTQLEKLQGKEVDTTNQGKPMFEVVTNDLGEAPELIPGGIWFNSDPLTISALKGKVVLVDFWTYTCINCIRTLPYLRSWNEKYKDKGLVIIGVHTPEFEFEKNAKNVDMAIADFKITYPIMQDNNFATWNAYENQYWPAKYFIDKNGRLRATHFGEGAYDESEKLIQKLLAEAGTDISNMPVSNPDYEIESRTPESYMGYQRIAALSDEQNVVRDALSSYTLPKELTNNTFGLGGNWTIEKEHATAHKGAILTFNFEAKHLYLVMRSNTPTRVRVSLDTAVGTVFGTDVTGGIVNVSTDRLYELISLPTAGRHTIKLEFLDEGTMLYAFTFG